MISPRIVPINRPVTSRGRGDPTTTRRTVMRALGAGALLAGAWRVSGQQAMKASRVAMLFFGNYASNAALGSVALFRQRLGELGYVDGKNVAIEERYAEGNAQRLNELARELVERKVDIIIVAATAAAPSPGGASDRLSPSRRATRKAPVCRAGQFLSRCYCERTR